ncbi:unnamed protein product [Parnassius apollo]|uniref:(apollo) hypothetical protein n=1 Tax=Parnassius apollo TaxID=110799 RepID=A0A8S3X1Y4_PARAO|nr:unnamed protein product [Parnassius apollo]
MLIEGFCRGCLIQYNEPAELLQYTEKNRRLFVYSTGIQVKRNDLFTFQLCKNCYFNMKIGCKFKKMCRNSDRKFKNYQALKEAGENVDFYAYVKNIDNDDSLMFRLPMLGYSTPSNKPKDDDNESTCTSIQNFISDIMASEEIPATEARIIREVIEEEADVLDDSLDSHWLQDDVSIDSNFKLDFSFSPFSTPKYVNNEQCYTPKKLQDETSHYDDPQKCFKSEVKDKNVEEVVENLLVQNVDETGQTCTIDKNLENALQNEGNKNVFLEDLLVTPPLYPNVSGPPTPLITNILFGDKLDSDSDDSSMHKVGQCIEKFETVQGDTDIFEEFFTKTTKDFTIEIKEIKENEEPELREELVKNVNNENEHNITNITENKNSVKDASSVEKLLNITNFYCKMCDKKFKNLVGLKVHCMRMHKLKIERKNPYTRKIRICDHCGKSYINIADFLKHIANHNKPQTRHVCKNCSLEFSSESKLKVHMSTHNMKLHPEPADPSKKKFVCSICGFANSSIANLQAHERRHSQSYSFHCEECGKGFYRKTDLTTHLRHHTGEKPFQCKYCSHRFARRDVLSAHMKSHTDQKPFQCQYCEQRYAKRYEFKMHFQNVKTCIEKRNKLVLEGKVTANSVSVYYASVVGTGILLDDLLNESNVQT